MVRKKLAMAVLALSALQADWASALGLGSLAVKSALNQPLNAEIRLLDTGDLDPSQIKVQLAAPEDFERAGVDRNFFLTSLKFTVDMDGRGSGVIHISTHDPVNEPYLNFVVEARWPNGRLLREFAVLLDPPTFSGGAAQAAPRAAASAPSPTPSRRIEPPTVASESAPTTAERIESNTLPEAAGASEHRVQVGETLSQIAGRHRPADASVQQTMVAIQRANPDAFIHNNVNLIKAGTILRLPSADDTRAVSAGEASQQIAEQSHAWRGGSTDAAAATGPQLDASQPQASAEGGYQEKERLSIATPGDSAKSSVGEGSGKGSKGLEALRNQLSASQESLDSAKRDNKEMQSRLDDMERQVATLQRLISLKDDQLAALQAKSSEQDKTPAQAPAAAQPAPAEAAPAPVAESPAPAATPAAPIEPKPALKAAPQPAPQPSFVDQLTSNPLYLGGGLAALVALLGGALFMKKRREQAEEESAYQELDLDDYTSESEATEASVDLDNALVSDDAVVDATHAEETAVAAVPEKKSVRSETGDAIAEADIYIAYGRYQQAVDLLTTAIDGEPDRTDLRMKLLEVFLEMRNREGFRQQFMALQGLGDSDAVAQVKDMLSSVDGVSDWLNDLPLSTSSSSSNMAAVAAIGAAVGAAAFAAESPAEVALEPVAEHDFGGDELDLDLDLDDELLGADEEAANEESGDNALLDLDLDLDSEDTAGELDLDLELDDLDMGEEATESADSLFDSVATEIETPYQPAPAFDPFANVAAPAAADAGELELDLDDDELELDLNEEDLDFALKAMGDQDSDVELSTSDALAEAPQFEVPAQSANDFSADNLTDFDLSLDSDTFSSSIGSSSVEADERKALEADLGDLGDLEGLDDLELDEEPAFASAPSFDNSFGNAPVEPSPFAELDEPVAAPSPEVASGLGDDFDFLADTDEVATKLDLARAYIDMGDTDGARDILDEVLQEGSDVQKQEASELMGRIA